MKHKAKPSGSSGGSRLRLVFLAAVAAAFLLVPVAQAAAENIVLVNIEGTGSGEVVPMSEAPFSEWNGEPPVECSYTSPGPATGVCETKMESLEPIGLAGNGIGLHAATAPGSEFVSWTVTEGEGIFECGSSTDCFMQAETGFDAEVTATFTAATPKFLLTVEKIGTGAGTVVSSPAGIECGATCSAEFEEKAKVTLTANPAAGSVFTSWTGCAKTTEGTGAKGRKCTVEMTKALTVKAKFTAVKAIIATKDSGGNGFGTVSSSPGGIACGSACTQGTAVFTEGSTVTLKAVAVASSSKFAGWTACEGTEEGNLCKVVASAAKSATAKFNLIPQFALTLSKSGFGTGTVSSSPAGISCGSTCSSAVAAYNEGKAVTLKAVAATGSEFGGWSGSGCSGTGTCTVTMSAAKSVTAEFK